MSARSYSRPAKQHLFLLVLPRATVAMNGQLDGDRGLFVPGMVGVKGKMSERNVDTEFSDRKYMYLFICK